MTTRPAHARTPVTVPHIDWRARTAPVGLDELTDAMLAPVQLAADDAGLPQTAWSSRFYGPDFVGLDCLLVSVAAVLGARPHDADPGTSAGLLTVLPTGWFAYADTSDAAAPPRMPGLYLDEACPVCAAQPGQDCDPDSRLCWGSA